MDGFIETLKLTVRVVHDPLWNYINYIAQLGSLCSMLGVGMLQAR